MSKYRIEERKKKDKGGAFSVFLLWNSLEELLMTYGESRREKAYKDCYELNRRWGA